MDPISTSLAAAQFLSSLIGANQKAKAQKRLAQYTNKQLKYQAGVSHDEFDKRLAAQNSGDQIQLGLQRDSANASDTNQRQALGQQLSTSGQGFDALLGLTHGQVSDQIGLDQAALQRRIDLASLIQGRNEALDMDMTQQAGSQALAANADHINIADQSLATRMGAEHSLLDTLRDVQTGNLALSADERARQEGYQQQADALARGFIDSSGRVSFDASQNAGQAQRFADISRAVTLPPNTTPVPIIGSANPVISRAYANEEVRGVNQGLEQARNAAVLNSYSDALRDQDRRQLGFGEQISLLDDRAGRSASNLLPQLNVNAIRADNATASRDSAVSIAQALEQALSASHNQGDQARQQALSGEAGRLQDALTREGSGEQQSIDALNTGLSDAARQDWATRYGAQSDLTRNLLGAFGNYYDQQGTSLNDFYGREGSAQSDYTGANVDASNALENGLINLSNMRIQSAGGSIQNAGAGWDALSQGFGALGSIIPGRTSSPVITMRVPPPVTPLPPWNPGPLLPVPHG